MATDPNAAVNLVSQQKQGFQSLLNRQKSEQQGLFGQYTKTVQSQPKLVDVLGRAQQDRGIGELQGSINLFQGQMSDVKGLLDRLNENTAARTSGTNANQAYLDRLRASEGGELNTQLGRLGAGLEPVVNAYQLASGDIGQLLSATSEDRSLALKPLELQINSLGDRFSREITGFTTGAESELNVLMDKLQRERQLADREWQRANQLAMQEAEFQRQRQYLTEQAKLAAGQQTSPLMQGAYNDVLSRGNDPGVLRSDYNATRVSANNGNQRDQLKIQLYHQLFPNIFGSAVSASALGNGAQLRF